MPYVEIYDEYESQEFVNNNIIDKNKLKQIIEKEKDLDIYLKEENNEIELNMYLLDICPESVSYTHLYINTRFNFCYKK